MLGFAGAIAIGTLVLMLPVASAAGTWTGPLDALFTATSAVCVTGLVVVDTATHWSLFGQATIIVLIQAGGLGFMAGSTLLLLLLVGRRTGLRDRLVAQAATGAPDLSDLGVLLRRILAFTVAVEVAGAVALGAAFWATGMDAAGAAWWGVFHAVSAFNNAGFDLAGGFRSMTGYAMEPVVLVPLGVLIVLGGLGFAIVSDVLAKRGWIRLALETKIVLLVTGALLLLGAVGTSILEWSNPDALAGLPEAHRATNAVFQSVTYRTAGFAAIDPGGLTDAALILGMALMFIGAASGSTGGGIKVNTFGLLLATVLSTARGRADTQVFGRRVPDQVVYRALTVALLSIAVVFVSALCLDTTSPNVAFIDALFEAVSAFATVGLTTGITPGLPDPARVVLIATMFVGRLGPLTLALAVAGRARTAKSHPAMESIRIG